MARSIFRRLSQSQAGRHARVVANGIVQVSVLGLGRLGAPVARRLRSSGLAVTGWSRSGRAPQGVPTAPDVTAAVQDADIVLLVLFDFAACSAVVNACEAALGPSSVIINLSTIAPEQADELADRLGDRYLHCPVLGSEPAARAGALTLLAGADKLSPEVEAVLSELGDVVPCHDAATAALLKLAANGVLADALVAVGRAMRVGAAAGLDPGTTLDVLERTTVGGLVRAKRGWLAGGDGPAQFAAGALRKDVQLLAAASPEVTASVERLLPEHVADDADIAELAVAYVQGPALLDERSHLFGRPGIDRDPALLAPLVAYARGHATGKPSYFGAAFRPTAHVEGLRDGRFGSWDLESYCANFDGHPAPGEDQRRRTVTELRRYGTVAHATMVLEHGGDRFIDLFLLVDDGGSWRIANKLYHRGT
jgi:3-hydroxyisobutyrate dehydrogenase-like beta-hydroxyacid dehydrogenase